MRPLAGAVFGLPPLAWLALVALVAILVARSAWDFLAWVGRAWARLAVAVWVLDRLRRRRSRG